jgi:hypothetical protein
MMRTATALAATLLCGAALWADGPGVRPRLNAHAYPASAALGGGSVGAEALSKTEVRNSFAADLNKGYIVFEVSFYPGPAGMKISPADFSLKLAQQDTPVRTSEPAVVARALEEKNAPKQISKGGVTVIPVATVGYESGIDNNGINGANGQRRSGVYTSVGVAVVGSVGAGGSGYPPGASNDRYSMEAELFDKSLPEGPITKPTAGYLYFPAPKGKLKNGATYELLYSGDTGSAKLAVPVPHEK